MPKPTLIEYAAKVVSLLAADDGKHYAFIMSGTEPLFAGTHIGPADATYETALVNVMQNNQAGYKKKSNVWALCSYTPTAMCRGMATVAGVDGMVYWNNTTLGYANTGIGHAETLMLQYYLRKEGLKKLPANFRIYTATTDMAALLAEKFKAKRANSAVLLADLADQTYRKLMLDQQKKKAVSAASLQQASPFKSTPDQRGELDTANKKRLGAEFVKSADKIMLWSTDSSDVKRQKAAQQGVEVFEALVTHGFTTAYGLRITDLLFNQIYERNKPKDPVVPVVVGVAK